MSFSWTELYASAETIKRFWLRSITPNNATISNIVAPVGARCAIISGVGAGGWITNSPNPGGGAAFARKKLIDIVDGESFQVQVGSTKFSLDAGSSSGDSIVTRVTGSVVVMKAVRGTGIVVNLPGNTPPIFNGGTPGLAVDCIGDTKRDGGYGNTKINGVTLHTGGFAAGDLNDKYSLGFGGIGAQHGRNAAARPGGGGIARYQYDANNFKAYPPGAGQICIDFLTKDPGDLI